MKIYVAHSRDFDYVNELYIPLKNDAYFKQFELILPHESDNYKHDREFYKNIDLVIAEVSFPSIGLGIELGFLYDDKKDVYCIHKKNKKISGSVKVVTENIFEYENSVDMINTIKNIIDDYLKK